MKRGDAMMDEDVSEHTPKQEVTHEHCIDLAILKSPSPIDRSSELSFYDSVTFLSTAL